MIYRFFNNNLGISTGTPGTCPTVPSAGRSPGPPRGCWTPGAAESGWTTCTWALPCSYSRQHSIRGVYVGHFPILIEIIKVKIISERNLIKSIERMVISEQVCNDYEPSEDFYLSCIFFFVDLLKLCKDRDRRDPGWGSAPPPNTLIVQCWFKKENKGIPSSPSREKTRGSIVDNCGGMCRVLYRRWSTCWRRGSRSCILPPFFRNLKKIHLSLMHN